MQTRRLLLTASLALAGLAAAVAQTPSRPDRLVNLSTRGHVAAGGSEIIAGFVVGGTQPRPVLLRGAAPGLAALGVGDALAQPRLRLYDAQGRVLREVFGWGGDTALAAAFGRLGAFAFAPGSADTALLTTLAPGTYTLHLGAAAGAGSALVEIYDAAEAGAGFERLVNISSRGPVSGTATVLTGGFVIGGINPKRVLVRGIGPGLAAFRVADALADPRVRVFRGATVVAENDNWGSGNTEVLAAAASASGAFALAGGSRDAALIVSLAPGAYTAQVDAVAGQAGTALVEIYELAADR